MSRSRRYRGHGVSEGTAAGLLYRADAPAAAADATPGEVRAAFAAVADERAALASRLRADGRASEAEIVSVAALIAADPVLVGAAIAAMQAGADATSAVQQAIADQAAVIAAVPDRDLAERAGDVRQVGIAVAGHLGGSAPPPPAEPFILIGPEVAAADLIELAENGLVGAASVAGGASSHASIVARGLGIPMITGVDPAVLSEPAGLRAILDAGSAELEVDPDPAHLRERARTRTTAPATARSLLTARTRDGVQVTILCNVASAAETRRGLADGASGVGLIRTEIPFAAATDWPSEAAHAAMLTPILDLLDNRVATVRLLDFSSDKVPPFLRNNPAGLAALLAHPAALRSQLRAVLRAGRRAELAIIVPMVSTLAEVSAVRDLLDREVAELGVARPRLGIMVELPSTAADAELFAPVTDFFSIGTNDLASQLLGLDRRSQAAAPGLAADPRVLALIEHVANSAAAAQIDVSVCGDAAADAAVLPLLIGLGVRTVSVPAARVTAVAGWISAWDSDACAAVAAKAVRASALGEVQDLVRDELVS
jgi:phosphoenolpyruvate-protein kinase (PTS system EI component)